jgi:hydrogenase maturation protease
MCPASEATPRVVVIGYGNTLRGDDGIGWRAIEALERSGVPANTTALTVHQLDPELARALSEATLALFVDAAREGEPGEVRCVAVSAGAPDSAFSHQLTPAALLALARSLYGASPAAFEITMCGERFDVCEELSPTCEAALPHLVSFLTDVAAAGVHPLPTREGGASRSAAEASAG